MRASRHALASALLAGGLYAAFRSPAMAAGAFLAGTLMDADHLVEYLLHFRPRLSLQHFAEAMYSRRAERVFLLLHAWEWILPWAWALWWSDANPWIVGGAAGWALHLALDHIGNFPRAWHSYTLVGRWRKKFRHDDLFDLNRKW